MLQDVSQKEHSFGAVYAAGKSYQIDQQAMIMAGSRASEASARQLRFVPEVADVPNWEVIDAMQDDTLVRFGTGLLGHGLVMVLGLDWQVFSSLRPFL